MNKKHFHSNSHTWLIKKEVRTSWKIDVCFFLTSNLLGKDSTEHPTGAIASFGTIPLMDPDDMYVYASLKYRKPST